MVFSRWTRGVGWVIGVEEEVVLVNAFSLSDDEIWWSACEARCWGNSVIVYYLSRSSFDFHAITFSLHQTLQFSPPMA